MNKNILIIIIILCTPVLTPGQKIYLPLSVEDIYRESTYQYIGRGNFSVNVLTDTVFIDKGEVFIHVDSSEVWIDVQFSFGQHYRNNFNIVNQRMEKEGFVLYTYQHANAEKVKIIIPGPDEIIFVFMRSGYFHILSNKKPERIIRPSAPSRSPGGFWS